MNQTAKLVVAVAAGAFLYGLLRKNVTTIRTMTA